MRKVSPRLVAIMMASVVSVTSIAPVTAYNHVTVNAAQLQQQAIDWTFTGNGKVDNDKIQLTGAGDNIGITNIKKEDNYAVKAKLTQGEEDGAVGVMMGAKEAKDPKKGSVVANVTPSTGAVRLICFQGGRNNDLQKEKVFDELKNKDTYDFDISVKQRHLTVKINGVKVISMEITDTIFEGKVGLISFNETMTASDFSVEDIAIPKATAHLTNLQVTGGDLDKKYTQDTNDYAITVPNTVDKLSITPTVSDNGTVTRGICVEDEAGYLHRVIETKGIIRNNQGTIDCDTEESKDIIQENNRVSMNMWAGYPCFIDYLENGFKEFLLDDSGDELTKEYLLPIIVDQLIKTNRASVKVLETTDKWFGVTYPEDKQIVQDSINELIEQGIYPEKLWK